jgi:hypothetical protein
MNLITGATIRGLIPAAAVIGVLAFSFLVPPSSLVSSENIAFGYGNNCGVKGYGYHDHGKPCPNRPFPGKGKGVTDISSDNSTLSQSTTGKSTKTSEVDDDATTVGLNTTSASDELTQSTSNGHRIKGHGHSKVGD